MTARITRLDIEGLRSIDKLSLDLGPMNVLIGENGSGKTTVLEALELLRKAATLPGEQFVQSLYEAHGGVALIRNTPGEGRRRLKLGVTIVPGGSLNHRYELTLEASAQGYFRIAGESFRLVPRRDTSGSSLKVFERDGQTGVVHNQATGQFDQLTLSATDVLLSLQGNGRVSLAADQANPSTPYLRNLLASSTIYPAFELNPAWARRPSDPPAAMRAGVVIQPARSLERGGANLPNAFHELRNRGAEAWSRVIETLQLGLGHDLVDVITEPSPSGGTIGLALVWKSVGSVPAFALSDGQLAFLAFVAISELEADRDGVVGFDEPDLHQHPAMIGRTVALCERLSERRTIVIATHSDRLLDALTDPADAVVLFERDRNGATIARRPSRAWLDKWLTDYSGLGGARAEGYGGVIFTEPAEAPSS